MNNTIFFPTTITPKKTIDQLAYVFILFGLIDTFCKTNKIKKLRSYYRYSISRRKKKEKHTHAHINTSYTYFDFIVKLKVHTKSPLIGTRRCFKWSMISISICIVSSVENAWYCCWHEILKKIRYSNKFSTFFIN